MVDAEELAKVETDYDRDILRMEFSEMIEVDKLKALLLIVDRLERIEKQLRTKSKW